MDPMNMLSIALDMATDFIRGQRRRYEGAGQKRAEVREGKTRLAWDAKPIDYAVLKARRLELGLRRAKRWKAAHPGVPFTEAPRHIIENQKAR